MFLVEIGLNLLSSIFKKERERKDREEAYNSLYENSLSYDNRYSEELEKFFLNNKLRIEQNVNKLIKRDYVELLMFLFVKKIKESFWFFLIFCVILHKILKDIQK